MPSDPSDEKRPDSALARETLARMKAGEKDAFDRFFTSQSARVLVYINYNLGERLRRKIEPADVLQNIYMKVFKNFGSFCERAERMSIKTVLIRMADHEITEAYRYYFKVGKRDARREVTGAALPGGDGHVSIPEWLPSDSTSVSARVVEQEDYQRVMERLRKLSPTEQFVTVARVIEGASTQEIAERLGKTRGAVRMIISRARDRLRG